MKDAIHLLTRHFDGCDASQLVLSWNYDDGVTVSSKGSQRAPLTEEEIHNMDIDGYGAVGTSFLDYLASAVLKTLVG